MIARTARKGFGWRSGVSLATSALLSLGAAHADAQGAKGTLRGKVQGGETLVNPVWAEASDAKSHRYTFRTRSTSAGKQQRQTAYLPRELCIAALQKEGSVGPRGTPAVLGISGGRTTPVTVVVSEGQPVQFVNHDPFPHRLYDVSKGGFGIEETRPGSNRTWKPPKAGIFEIRDQVTPSVRSWIVVEPRAAQSAHVRPAGDFVLRDLEPGTYELQGYFAGKPVGKAVTVDVKPGEQDASEPLVVGETKKADEEK